MPKLLQINIVSNVLSTGKISEGIASVATRNGWDCYVAYGRSAKAGTSKEIHVGSKLDEYEHYAEHLLFDNDGLASRSATKKLINQIRDIQPDVIHLHNIHGHFLNYKILFEYLDSIETPVVWTLHDCLSFTGGCAYFDMIPCDKWKTSCEKCPIRKGKLFDRSSYHFNLRKRLFTAKKNLTMVPVSNWIAEPLKESFLKDKPIHVIHNGIDLSVFKPLPTESVKLKYGISDEFVIIGVAAPWSARKGLPDFVKLRDMLSNDYRIILVGLSDQQIKDLPDGIIGIKRTSNATELAELYSSADVFVNPTYSDNFPTTNLEALACGTPVITYKTGGSPEAIDSKTGVVINQGDVTALANTIMYMKANPYSSEACRKRAEEYFDKDKCFEKYIKLYNSVIYNILGGGNLSRYKSTTYVCIRNAANHSINQERRIAA